MPKILFLRIGLKKIHSKYFFNLKSALGYANNKL